MVPSPAAISSCTRVTVPAHRLRGLPAQHRRYAWMAPPFVPITVVACRCAVGGEDAAGRRHAMVQALVVLSRSGLSREVVEAAGALPPEARCRRPQPAADR